MCNPPEESDIGCSNPIRGGVRLGILNTHHLSEEEGQTSKTSKSILTSVELLKALRTGKLCGQLLREIGMSSERAILVVPLREGPLGAIHTLQETEGDSGNFDNVTPLYLDSAHDYSKANAMCYHRRGSLVGSEKAEPLSVCYEGGSGETLLNSARILDALCRGHDRQIALNVRIQTSSFGHIQSALEDFDSGPSLDLGYAEDSLVIPEFLDPYGFFSGWDLGEGDMENRTRALLRQFLFKRDRFRGSPLQSVEVVRAHIIGLIGERPEKGHGYHKRLHKRLDKAYDELFNLSRLNIHGRNSITGSLVSDLRTTGIIVLEDNYLKPGDQWNEKKDLLDCYIDYHNSHKL